MSVQFSYVALYASLMYPQKLLLSATLSRIITALLKHPIAVQHGL